MIIILLAGCGKDEMPQPAITPVDISCCVIPTRTSISGTTTSFISGDKIGVSETLTKRNNVQFSYNATSTHTFYGYYPYNASSNRFTLTPLLGADKNDNPCFSFETTYTVNISRTAITISTPTITPWTDGGTSTVNPSL